MHIWQQSQHLYKTSKKHTLFRMENERTQENNTKKRRTMSISNNKSVHCMNRLRSIVNPQPECLHQNRKHFYLRFGDKYLWACLVWQLVKHKSIGYNAISDKWTFIAIFRLAFSAHFSFVQLQALPLSFSLCIIRSCFKSHIHPFFRCSINIQNSKKHISNLTHTSHWVWYITCLFALLNHFCLFSSISPNFICFSMWQVMYNTFPICVNPTHFDFPIFSLSRQTNAPFPCIWFYRYVYGSGWSDQIPTGKI